MIGLRLVTVRIRKPFSATLNGLRRRIVLHVCFRCPMILYPPMRLSGGMNKSIPPDGINRYRVSPLKLKLDIKQNVNDKHLQCIVSGRSCGASPYILYIYIYIRYVFTMWGIDGERNRVSPRIRYSSGDTLFVTGAISFSTSAHIYIYIYIYIYTFYPFSGYSSICVIPLPMRDY